MYEQFGETEPVRQPSPVHVPPPESEEPSPYDMQEDENTYNLADEPAPQPSQGGQTAVALYDYQAGKVMRTIS